MKTWRSSRKPLAFTLTVVVMAAVIGLAVFPSLRSRAVLPTVSVSGNKLVANGQEVILRGVNTLDVLAMRRYMGHFDNGYFAEIASWGAKVVRIPIHPSEWHHRFFNEGGNANKMETIEQAVAWAANNGMYSIVDWHVIGSLVTGYFQNQVYKTTQAETEEFWSMIATAYKDDPRVAAYELINEPVTSRTGWQVTEADWIAQRNWYEGLVDVIRAIDPNKPIICNGLDWGYNLQYAAANPVRRSGIAYGAHPYPVKSLPWESYFGYLKATYPVLATEFGFQNNGSSVYDESAYAGPGTYRTDLDTYLESKGIGWMVWNYGPQWEPILVVDWSYTPSEQGYFYRDRLWAASGGPPPTPTPVPGGALHVSNIAMSSQKTGQNYKALATVTIVDAANAPVAGASVSGTFSGATSNTVSGATGTNGNVTLTSGSKKNGGTWTFCVDDVTKSGWTYDSAANIETCDSITAP